MKAAAYTLDHSASSVVGICHHCGARVLARHAHGALTQLADHHDRAHHGPNTARHSLTNATRRTIA